MQDNKEIDISKWKWQGTPGHFCCSDDCHFHLSTVIGDVLVSTVGLYYPRTGPRASKLRTIGEGHYETLVFNYDPVSGRTDYSEIDSDSLLITDTSHVDEWNKDAERMHLEMCQKWSLKGYTILKKENGK